MEESFSARFGRERMNQSEVQASEQEPEGRFRRALKALAEGRRYALFITLVLFGIWSVGRAFEAVYQSVVFEPALAFWMGAAIWFLVAFFLLGAGIHYWRKADGGLGPYGVAAWAFLGLVGVGIILTGPGYRVAAGGLFATVAGMAESAHVSFFTLFKSFSLTPSLPLNLLVAEVSGLPLELESLSPFVWQPLLLFGLFVWSLVYGALLLRMAGARFFKSVHLGLSAAALVTMMVLKSTSGFTDAGLVFFQGFALVLLLLQVLLTYSSLREVAVQRGDKSGKESVSVPPPAYQLALCLLVALPLLADIQNQFALASKSRTFTMGAVQAGASGPGDFITATRVSIRSGPTVGDELVGVLPKDSEVRVIERQGDWARIGENEWISSKYLSPKSSG